MEYPALFDLSDVVTVEQKEHKDLTRGQLAPFVKKHWKHLVLSIKL
jgi:hypothetical protein